MNLEERVEQLEFQLELLFNNAGIDRFIYESKLTRLEYRAIMDLMDKYRSLIDGGKEVNHVKFEQDIYEIVPQKNGDYHFCELITKLWADEHQWEEVFMALYSDMPKYRSMQ